MKTRVALMALLLLAGAVMRLAGAGNLLSNGGFKEQAKNGFLFWNVWHDDKKGVFQPDTQDGVPVLKYTADDEAWTQINQQIRCIRAGKKYLLTLTHKESPGFTRSMIVGITEYDPAGKQLKNANLEPQVPPAIDWTTWKTEYELAPGTASVSVSLAPRGKGTAYVKNFSVERVGPEEHEPLPEIKAVEGNLFVNPDFKENEDGKMQAWTTWGTDKNTTIERIMSDGRAQYVYSSPVLSWAGFMQTIEDIEGGKTYVFSMTHRESEGFNWNMAVPVTQYYQDQTLRTDYISSAIPPACAWTTWSGEIELEPKTDRVLFIVNPRGMGQAAFAYISLKKK